MSLGSPNVSGANSGPNTSSLLELLPVQYNPDSGAVLSTGRNLSLVDALGLSVGSQTLNQYPVENQSLGSGAFLTTNAGSQNVINLSGGPGILTQFTLTLFNTANNGNVTKGLLFTFTIDGGQYTLQFDGDLWSTSQFPSNSTIPDISTPFVWECDHLIALFGKDSSNDALIQLVFKYPIPFSSSLQLTIQNQSYTGGSFAGVYLNYAAQMGISSPRRLQSSFVNANTPAQIPSAVEYASGTTYATGNLATYQGVLYQSLTSSNQGNTPSSSPSNWGVASTSANPNFNTGYPLLSIPQPCWLAHLTLNGQGAVTGGTYGSVGTSSLSFLESNLAVYDGNLNPLASFAGASPNSGLIFNSSGTEDFMGGSFYWATIGDYTSKVTVPTSVASSPFNVTSSGKNKQLRHGFVVSAASAFMGANVDLLSYHSGGIRCGTSCLMRWEEGNVARSQSGPILANNTWKINPTVLYYI